jgi:endo-1,3(4)-beta-glucanase
VRRRLTAIALCALLLAACHAEVDNNGGVSGHDVLPENEVSPFLDGIGHADRGTVIIDRLATGLLPPTNRWYSGLVFGAHAQPVFPLPLSFELGESGFGVGVPTVVASADHVRAPAVTQLQVELGSTSVEVSRYDDVSVSLRALRDGDELATVTIARGSPIVSIVAIENLVLELSAPLTDRGDGVFDSVSGFGVVAPASSADGARLTLAAGAFANVVAVPQGGSIADLAPLASSPLTGVSTAWQGTTTTLEYETADGSPTLVGALPHQIENATCTHGSFDSILGTQRLCSTSSLSWSVATVEPSAALDLSGLGAEQRAELTTQVGTDLAATRQLPVDTYFGGKALARLANLLQLARQLGDESTAAAAKQRLSEQLLAWETSEDCVERCFVYDPVIGGIVGQPASFGSEEFNDHHFHYGYFLYAAAVVAAGDAELAEQLRPTMTLLAADIASGTTTGSFPARRVFDPYSGHSWASGYAPFADSNNQESSSEAVAAWNGLALWADTVDDAALGQQARWMLSAEADAAQRYFLDPTTYPGYGHEVVGILWDGKVDYGTWFSADPGAMLGIQLLPMQPVASYLGDDRERIRAQLAEARAGTLFADYLLMYESLTGDDVIAAARDLPAAAIDDGNSRSYLLAWVMTH